MEAKLSWREDVDGPQLKVGLEHREYCGIVSKHLVLRRGEHEIVELVMDEPSLRLLTETLLQHPETRRKEAAMKLDAAIAEAKQLGIDVPQSYSERDWLHQIAESN